MGRNCKMGQGSSWTAAPAGGEREGDGGEGKEGGEGGGGEEGEEYVCFIYFIYYNKRIFLTIERKKKD
jgi:hypothetical protein